jgi:23S rRNA pseudouridine1911/1915/1917 synthase
MALLRSNPACVPTSKPHWIVTSEQQGVRLDRFLAATDRLGSRGRVRVALDRGQVFVNEAEAQDGAARLVAGDTVSLWMDRPGSASRRKSSKPGRLHILYEDATLLAVNKPAGLLAVPLGRGHSTASKTGKPFSSAYSSVAEHLGPRRRRPFVVHRIDRDTSGIVVFAKTVAAQRAIKDQFARREPERIYWAVVHGHPRPARGRWRDHLAWDDDALKQTVTDVKNRMGVEAISDYRVLETFADASLVEVRLHTGKRNQIRIQAARRGHALLGERQYAKSGASFPRQALHAYRLSFAHPIDGRQLTFEAPLPQDLADLLYRLRRAAH